MEQLGVHSKQDFQQYLAFWYSTISPEIQVKKRGWNLNEALEHDLDTRRYPTWKASCSGSMFSFRKGSVGGKISTVPNNLVNVAASRYPYFEFGLFQLGWINTPGLDVHPGHLTAPENHGMEASFGIHQKFKDQKRSQIGYSLVIPLVRKRKSLQNHTGELPINLPTTLASTGVVSFRAM